MRRPSTGCTIITHEFRGAAARFSAESTAFGFRQPHVLIEIVAQHDDEDGLAERSWAAETMAVLKPMAQRGAYANFLPENDDRAQYAYGPNAYRLADLKLRYDPDNIFGSAIPLPAMVKSTDAKPGLSPKGK